MFPTGLFTPAADRIQWHLSPRMPVGISQRLRISLELKQPAGNLTPVVVVQPGPQLCWRD